MLRLSGARPHTAITTPTFTERRCHGRVEDGRDRRSTVSLLQYGVGVVALLDAGIYDAHEVSRLLAISPARVVRWSVPDSKGRTAIVPHTHARSFNFVDLVSFAVAVELWHRNVSEADLRAGVAYLCSDTDLDRPLANKSVVDRLATSGATLLVNVDAAWYDVGRQGQGAFEEIIRVTLREVSFDEVGQARLWRPAPRVSLDPRVQAGAPCVEGTRVPTEVVADMAEVDGPELVADDLNLTVEEVLAAVEFEATLNRGVGIAA